MPRLLWLSLLLALVLGACRGSAEEAPIHERSTPAAIEGAPVEGDGADAGLEGFESPVAAVRREVTVGQPDVVAQGFRVVKIVQLRGGVVVTYQMPSLKSMGGAGGIPQGLVEVYGTAFVVQQAGGWTVESGGQSETSVPHKVESRGLSTFRAPDHMVIMGPVTPDVVQVDAVFKDGEIMRHVPAQGYFAFVHRPQQQLCSVQFVRPDGSREVAFDLSCGPVSN